MFRNRNGSRLATSFALAALMQGAGCAGDSAAVDRVEQALDLMECFGADTRCEPTVATETVAMPEPRACDGEPRAGLVVEPLVDFGLDGCATRGDHTVCTTTGQGASVLGADGTLWTMANTVEQAWSEDSIWVRRYGADGARLGVTDLTPELPVAPSDIIGIDLALDARGRGRAVMYQSYGYAEDAERRAWLFELDQRGQVARGPVALGDIGGPSLELSGDGGVLVLGSDPSSSERGSLSRFDASGARIWSQTDVRGQANWGVLQLASLEAGAAAVISPRSVRSIEQPVRYGITRYDGSGNVVWDREIDEAFEYIGSAPAVLDHAEGGVLVHAIRSQAPKGRSEQRWLLHVAADGSIAWGYLLDTKSSAPVALHPQSGEVYVAALEQASQGPTQVLDVISPDGERCARFSLPQAQAQSGLELKGFDEQGRLLAIGNQSQLLRVQLPQE